MYITRTRLTMLCLKLVALLLSLFVTISLGASIKDAQVTYDNYKVYKLQIENEAQYEVLKTLRTKFELNFWGEAREYGDSCDIMVTPTEQLDFEKELNLAKFKYEITIENVQSLINAEKVRATPLDGRSARDDAFNWTKFQTLAEINAWVDQIVERFSDVVTPFTIGRSYEGRLIKGIKISYKSGNKAAFIESNIHAREWITSSSVTYFIDQLLVSRIPAVRDIAENLDWYIIPVLNVDGFAYSHEKERLWRKSRMPSGLATNCIGTDLNRNFDFLWMSVGASDDPCSETYAGPSAESDPEIKQMLQFINTTIPDDTIKIYISMHSYGQYVLSPWGHTDTEFPDNYAQMMAVAKGYADALKRRYSTEFTYGSSATTLYKVSGSGKEWAYGVKGIPIAYTIELRDKRTFILPPELIIPVGREVLDGLVGMVLTAREVGVL